MDCGPLLVVECCKRGLDRVQLIALRLLRLPRGGIQGPLMERLLQSLMAQQIECDSFCYPLDVRDKLVLPPSPNLAGQPNASALRRCTPSRLPSIARSESDTFRRPR
jgi:hypothetical protein